MVGFAGEQHSVLMLVDRLEELGRLLKYVTGYGVFTSHWVTLGR